MLTTLKKIILGDPNEKLLREYAPTVEKINALEAKFEKLNDEELKNQTLVFKARLQKGELLDNLLPEAFAVVREAAKRTLKQRHFDVQLIGGIVLHEGKIAEMKTGEGKTLVSTLAAYLNALTEKGVYIVTVNDYLARRDSEWMGEIYKFLGLTVGLTISGMDAEDKVAAYKADITYGTNNEFGFDYLRDNLVQELEECCQLRKNFAVIDEVDCVLIDEARTPLIISGPVQDSTDKYIKIAKIVKKLQKETHYTVDEKHKNVVLTEDGISKIEKELNVDNIFSMQYMDVAHMAVQCLKATNLFEKDVDYIVKNGEVLIVDEFTGRLLEGRRYSDGLHQAIEAVENLHIKEENQTLASVTFQNYFRMFPKLSGMTGTAITEEEEFVRIYGLPVVIVPTNMPMIREDESDVIYKSKKEKYHAIITEIKECYKKGQPVLVGTIAIATSELLSSYLKKEGLPHSVLNAKYHEQEAEIVARAGQIKTVTIATNMAGRGTDIKLGEGVVELGGLRILGTERHESRRIDNQLRGRSGRQGDPGSSKFYVSLEDELMRLFGSERIAKIMETFGLPENTPIEHPLISRSIGKAQKKVEQYHFSVRKQILEYDNVLNKQRETVYTLRQDILAKKNLDKKVKDMIKNVIQQYGSNFEVNNNQKVEPEELVGFLQQIQEIFPIEGLEEKLKHIQSKKDLIDNMIEGFYQFYLHKKNKYPQAVFEDVTKMIILRNLDSKWMDQLYNMDVLKEGIGLRAWGQQNPLLEYKKEAFNMFQGLLNNVSQESIELLNRVEVMEAEKEAAPMALPMHMERPDFILNRNEGVKAKPVTNKEDKVGRNDFCPCGSGKKYKKCCMK
ncbi:preprotein translocase subunit SecA [bacterium]|jgi:preprotein translocase subunit SecA|nr:preprotein translocase subunit SecA [bacterium]MBT3581905.1 preprotein translocase subunit SecA [bacterium]MBT4551429.1 preprotein translocase subunit SecA [bacterium]MBT5988720.1 preprotein translocase subunit SecA [bacterium]MBT7088262.1 preprotein translocase subunit SecA [bacterium]